MDKSPDLVFVCRREKLRFCGLCGGTALPALIKPQICCLLLATLVPSSLTCSWRPELDSDFLSRTEFRELPGSCRLNLSRRFDLIAQVPLRMCVL
jgi:hypothetical protein